MILQFILSCLSLYINYNYANNIGPSVFVVGSINADLTFPLEKLPQFGETVVSKTDNYVTVAGGKGANQAVSCSRMGCQTYFSCNFGNDEHAKVLENVLNENNVNLKYCHHSSFPSGLGLVFLQSSGSVSAIVVGGSNIAWPKHDVEIIIKEILNSESGIACIMLQMEIPQHVNQLYAEVASTLGIPVFQDVGGEERELSDDYLKLLTYISPNLTELERLTKMPVNNESEILAAAKSLQLRGARNVLVTLGADGSLLLTEKGEIIKQSSFLVDKVIDETGAGDNYRAAFVVSHFVEKKSLQESLTIAAISGAISVTKAGAIPACTTRAECEQFVKNNKKLDFIKIKGGRSHFNNHNDDLHHSSNSVDHNNLESSPTKTTAATATTNTALSSSVFPWKFASRLNSMKDRWELTKDQFLNYKNNNNNNNNNTDDDIPIRSNVFSWIKRQGLIQGLDYVDFNYPQHLQQPVNTKERDQIVTALNEAKLNCGAICVRFPKEMQGGAYTNPNKVLRERAIAMTKEACEWALVLGAQEVVVWSAFCGYDYSFQVDYDTMWNQVVNAFQSICDAFPTLKISLEYKPTDENTRYFAVESTGSAILLMKEINRPNFGLTIDFGHCLMAGENPAQSIASVARHSRYNSNSHSNGNSYSNGNVHLSECKLYGVQLGDGYGRLGAEDGLAFGSIHPMAALEFVYWLIKIDFKGHIYFDTFPRNEDPVRECEYNIRTFKKMYYKMKGILQSNQSVQFKKMMENRDAMGLLEFFEQNFDSSDSIT